MKKALKKVVSSTLALTVCLGIPFAANASSESANIEEVSEKDVLFTVEVKSEEELNAFLAELAAHNEKSRELWERALAESKNTKENTESVETNKISPMALSKSEAKTTVGFGHNDSMKAMIGAYVTYNKIEKRFGTVKGFYMYGRNTDTTVGNVDYEYTKIDNDRTLAVHSTSLVGVKNDMTGGFSYFTYEAYIEFYDGGGEFL
ncbi:hypothetical protein [Brevibacillus porteri]|uniref:hypothetical protein n=1 Tax=Brevibacillus porteri TaxID=2126350 RepID=UPI00362A38E3